jgi:outer membrane receptor protein involved in Fe transport
MTASGGPISAAPDSASESPIVDQVIAQAAPAATANPNATLTGTVFDGATNKVLGGVALTITGGGQSYSTTSGADGTFSISIPQGVYDIDASKGGFQAGRASAFALTAGVTSNLPIYLTEAGSSSLRTIGRVAVSRRNSLNLGAGAQTSLDNATIQAQDLPTLTTLAEQLPGVTPVRTTGATANTFFDVRGTEIETRTNIDGHPLSVGTFGAYNTNYAIGAIFDQVEVLKGAGLNGPTAGESAFGTVNLRTRDFSPKNYLDVKGGLDSFNGSFYNIFGNVNLLNGRLSLLGGRAFSGYNGPYDNYIANRIGTFGTIVPGTGQAPTFPGLIQWQGDLSNRNYLAGELAKARFRFSSSTSLSATYLGLQGQYIPQGGAYASYYGNETVQACYNGSTPSPTLAGCTTQSQYNPPYAQNLVGTTVPAYGFFPSSYVQNNEPQFSAELRTALKNDTILLRPYTALINRFISGDRENRYPGNNGGFYQVTSDANCQAAFVAPTTTANGAKGPCFANNFAGLTGPAYIGAGSPSTVVYSTTSKDPGCSATRPCYTTPTAFQNNGLVGFGAPFSQPEVDHLHGVTFQYLHPVHDNLYGLSYDYNADDTYSTTSDTTAVAPGCTAVIGTAAGTVQPSCLTALGTPFSTLPRTDISIPPTIVRKNDFALTAQNQLAPALQSAIGLYYTNYHSQAQTENPAVLATYATSTGGVGSAPVALVQNYNSVHHFDPHIGFTFRADPNIVIRATGGSSITLPYASLISGIGSVDLPNGANNMAYTLTLANSGLEPETTVAYDLGTDIRLPDTSIFQVDLYDNTIHNIFANVKTTIAPVAGITAPGGFFQSETINGPIGRFYGLELGINKVVPVGFGYTATASLERAYYDQLPTSIYTSRINLINDKQFDGSSNGEGAVPYAKGYAEIRYSGLRNSLLSLGADYEGANNSTYGPAYTIFNSTIRFEVAPQVAFQMSIDNLFNLNTGSALGRALFNQGSQTLTYGPATLGAPFTAGTTTKSLQEVDFRTVRFSLQHRF